MAEKISIFWFRRDLRLTDNIGLVKALQSRNRVLCIFIFDKNILSQLVSNSDARVTFIYNQLFEINEKLHEFGSSLRIYNGYAEEIWEGILQEYAVDSVFCNEDYESYALKRDCKVGQILQSKGAVLHKFKDQAIFAKDDILKNDGMPYTVFTPYYSKWRAKFNMQNFSESDSHHKSFLKEFYEFPRIEAIGFQKTSIALPSKKLNESFISQYDAKRDIPMVDTSLLGIHLRFGTISIRKLALYAVKCNENFLRSLAWRDFFMQILYHFPHVEHSCFKKKYDAIEWRNNEDEFDRWKRGETGYAIVDAGMRQLNSTGFMHNRVRMIVASFLTKHLLIDWRWGEAYFAEKLLDFDLASNNGNWQWAAGCGCDAAPYFRIFNPYEQTKKFDKNLEYIRKWIPEFDSRYEISPIVEHKFARERALAIYKRALQNVV